MARAGAVRAVNNDFLITRRKCHRSRAVRTVKSGSAGRHLGIGFPRIRPASRHAAFHTAGGSELPDGTAAGRRPQHPQLGSAGVLYNEFWAERS